MGSVSAYQPNAAIIPGSLVVGGNSATGNGPLVIRLVTASEATTLSLGTSQAWVMYSQNGTRGFMFMDGVPVVCCNVILSSGTITGFAAAAGFAVGNAPSSNKLQVSGSTGILANYDGAATVGNGMAAEIAAVATGSPVALATSSTTVLTLTSTLTTGTYLVSINAMSTAAAQVATFTVAYEDNSFSVAATATITSGTLGSGAAFGQTIEINAKTGTAITVSGSCTTANDVKATAHIFGPL